MTSREYLLQSSKLDEEINAKIESLDALKAIATKITIAGNGMPKAASDPHSKENVIIKIAEASKEINDDIDRLVEIRKDISRTINKVKDQAQRVILIKRYINHDKWEKIACDMGYDIRAVYVIHRKALKSIEKSLQ